MTTTEKIQWEKLRKKHVAGFKFRCQHPIYRYVLNFCCSEKLLAIEIDGDIHKDRKDHDEYQDDPLKRMGTKTLRFTNHEVEQYIEEVICIIEAELNSEALSLVPPPGDRGYSRKWLL